MPTLFRLILTACWLSLAGGTADAGGTTVPLCGPTTPTGACGGVCAEGFVCQPDTTGSCLCVPDLPPPCASLSGGSCAVGECPPGLECLVDADGFCGCEALLFPCGESTTGLCDGECPDDEVCLPDTLTGVCNCEPSPTDSDGDGIPDGVDACVDSDLGDTVVIDGRTCGVENPPVADDGCTLTDLVQDALDEGGLAALLALLADLEAEGVVTPAEADAIAACAEGGDDIGDTIPIDIDVTPPSEKNDKVVVTAEFVKVAILSTTNPRFEPAKEIKRGINVSQLTMSDARTPNKKLPIFDLDKGVSVEDVNDDGIDDLVLCFSLANAIKLGIIIPENIIKKGQKTVKKTTRVRIDAAVDDGSRFGQPVTGEDTIKLKKK